MTRIDFYVQQAPAADHLRLACRIAAKAWRQGHRVLLETDDEAQADGVDRLLWTFSDQAFLPHGRLGRADAALNPILVGCGSEPGEEHDVLINLAAEVPTWFSRFNRVIECIDASAHGRDLGRRHFRFYRDHGYPIHTHELD